MNRRAVVLAAVAALALAAVAALGWQVTRDDTYAHALERYDNETGEPNVYVNLPDGEAQLALGSPDGHRLVVQWRDPDGHGWTAPQTVWEDRENEAVENTVRYGGGTAVIVEAYTADVHDDSDLSASYVAVVCRDLVCDARPDPGASVGQVTPDGSTAYLGQSEQGVVFWDADDGFVDAPWDGHPGLDSRRSSVSSPVLAPDGSLRLVAAAPARGACTFELLTSEPRAAALTSGAERTEPLRGPRPSECRSYTSTWSDAWLTVHPDDHRAATFSFVEEDGAWTSEPGDASGLDVIDVGRGCCDTGVQEFVHWNEVAYGSPDGRRIQVQSHLLGQDRWSDPVVLGGAPPGERCTWADGYEAGPSGFAVVMTCPGGYAVAASPDLEQWTSAYLPGSGQAQVVGDDTGLTVGDRRVWTPTAGFAP